MNYYKRNIGDYIRDTRHLTILQHGVYTLLLDAYYHTENPLPADRVASLIGVRSRAEKAALDYILHEFFVFTPNGWEQDRCEREIKEAYVKIKSNRENGKLGGRPKLTRLARKPTKNPTETQPKPNGNLGETQTKPTGNPDANPNITYTITDDSLSEGKNLSSLDTDSISVTKPVSLVKNGKHAHD